MPNNTRLITDTELQVLKALWRQGKGTVRELHEALAEEGRPWAYTTVLTLLQRLQEKGYVKASKQGRAHVYEAKAQRDDLLRKHLDELVERVCEGTTMPLMLTLFQGQKFSPEEIERFRGILDQLEAEEKQTKKKRGGRKQKRSPGGRKT